MRPANRRTNQQNSSVLSNYDGCMHVRVHMCPGHECLGFLVCTVVKCSRQANASLTLAAKTIGPCLACDSRSTETLSQKVGHGT